jgi:hypothetical protein
VADDAAPARSDSDGDRLRWTLLEDGGLILTAERTIEDLLERWIPNFPPDTLPRPPHSTPGCIHVGRGELASRIANRPNPSIEVLGLRAWAPTNQCIELRTETASLAGRIRLPEQRADIEIADESGEDLRREVFCALTVCAALVLGRQGKLLLHAGAFVAPDGHAWLLIGASQCGKSSTCANIIRLGWQFLADDQVVVSTRENGEVWIEGWPRNFNLDTGFEQGLSTGIRYPVDATHIGAGRWQRSAPLGGLLFPEIAADDGTQLFSMTPADALQEIIRQSPWLLADGEAAPDLLAQMMAMVNKPAYRFRLGFDSYRNPAALLAVLEPAVVSVSNKETTNVE